jgi:gliding motility-associated-like protein
MIRGYSTSEVWVVAQDGISSMQIPAQTAQRLMGTANSPTPQTAYLVTATTTTSDLTKGILKNVYFQVLLGGIIPAQELQLDNMATLRLPYTWNGSTLTVGGLGTMAVKSDPTNLSVFWNNGDKWLQLYGQNDTTIQVVYVQTPFFGTYQLRTAERTGSFAFNSAGLTNRYLTPNSDRKNDNITFKFDNPNNSTVEIKIFDSRGRLVLGSLPAGPMPNSLIWDGTVNGQGVASGVYIYQIKGEGLTYTGTVVIIK